MNELGIKSVVGKEYWTIYGVKRILSNPVYIGKIRWGYRKVKRVVTPEGKKKTREFSEDGEYFIVNGLHKAIISDKVWKAAQVLIAENPPAPIKYRAKSANPFTGVLYCAKCRHAMSMRPASGRQPYAYIGCNTAGCCNKASPFPLVEQRFLSVLRSWADEYDVSKDKEKQEAVNKSELGEAVANLEKELASLNIQLNNVYTFFERGTYTEEVFRQRSSALEAQIAEMNARIKNLKTEYSLALERQKARAEFAPAISRLLEIYVTLSPSEKNGWFKQIIERAYYEKNESGQFRNITPDCFTLQVFPHLPKTDS